MLYYFISNSSLTLAITYFWDDLEKRTENEEWSNEDKSLQLQAQLLEVMIPDITGDGRWLIFIAQFVIHVNKLCGSWIFFLISIVPLYTIEGLDPSVFLKCFS
jgi:hypothetical protein